MTSLDCGKYSASRCLFLHADEVEILQKFYHSLDADLRHMRFGAAVLDRAIAQHCHAIDWDRSIIIGHAGRLGLDAVVEIHPLSLPWSDADAELAIACNGRCETIHILAQLFQVAAFAAGERGCVQFVVLLTRIASGAF